MSRAFQYHHRQSRYATKVKEVKEKFSPTLAEGHSLVFAQLIKLLTCKDCFSEKWLSVHRSPSVDLYSSVVKSIFLFVLTKVPL